MKRRRVLALHCIALLILPMAAASCAGQPSAATPTQGEEQATPAEQGAAETIKIGVPTPLSPPADYKAGEINVNTVNLAIKNLNEQGGALGRMFEAVVIDDEGDVATGVSVVTKLITEDKVAAIVGPWHGSVALAQSEVADQYKVPIMLHYSWPDDITAMHSDYVFRVSPYNSQIAQLLVPFIQQQGYQNIAVMAEDSAYGTGFADAMKALAETSGFDTVVRVFPAESLDLTPQLLELKAMTPPIDLLLISAVYEPMYLIPKQAREAGLGAQIMAGWDYPGWSPEYWETTGEAGVDVYYPTFFSNELALSPLGEQFKADYKEAYGHEPPIYAYFLYDEVMMIAEAIKEADSADSAKIAETLKDMTFEGTTGVITFERRDTPGDPVWNQWLGQQIFIMKTTAVGEMQEDHEVVFP